MKSSFIALSGMQVAQQRLNATAHNTANQQTEGFRRQEVNAQNRAEGGVTAQPRQAASAGAQPVADVVERKSAGHLYAANLKVIQTERQLMGQLLDEKA